MNEDIRPGDVERRVSSCLMLVHSLAWRFNRHVQGGLEREDLVGAGSLGLVEAAERWVEGPIPFASFAYPFIRGRMLDALRAEWRAHGLHGDILPKWPDGFDSVADPNDEQGVSDEHPLLQFHPRLTGRNLQLVQAVVLDDRPLKEAGRGVGLSEGRACVVTHEALHKLRRIA